MPKGPVDHRPDTRLAWAMAVVVVAASLAPVIIALVFGDRLPAEVPRHYGADGQPTATWPLWTSVSLISVTTLVVAGGCAALCVLLRMPLVPRRWMAWTVTWVAALLGGVKTGILIQLIDVTDPMTSGSVSTTLLISLLVGVALGIVVAAFAQEQPHGRTAAHPPAKDLPRVADGEVARWESAMLTSRALVVVLVVCGLVLLIPAIIVGPFGEGAWLLVLTLVCLAPALMFVRVRVVIDEQGLAVRGAGFRFLHIPIDEVVEATVIEHVDPFWEFGGWGWRVDVHGRTGIVSRAGEALRVVRGDDTEVIITVDDAATAAATLHAFADRHHAR